MNTLEIKINEHISQIQTYTKDFKDTEELIKQYAQELVNANLALQKQAKEMFKSEELSRQAYQELATALIGSNATQTVQDINALQQQHMEITQRIASVAERIERSLAQQ